MIIISFCETLFTNHQASPIPSHRSQKLINSIEAPYAILNLSNDKLSNDHPLSIVRTNFVLSRGPKEHHLRWQGLKSQALAMISHKASAQSALLPLNLYKDAFPTNLHSPLNIQHTHTST